MTISAPLNPAPNQTANLAAASAAPNLPLRGRGIDIFFAIVFTAFTITSIISDLLPTVGVNFAHPTGNFFVDSNYWYAHDADPLFMHPPDWMRIVTGLSAFVYMPFYVVLVRKPDPFKRKF